MKRSYRYSFLCFKIPLLSIFLFLLPNLEVRAEEKSTSISRTNPQIAINTKKNNSRQLISTSAKDLLEQEARRQQLAQNSQQAEINRVTEVKLNQTESGLQIILKTVAGSEKLVPLILPEGNNLVIEILDATLAFAIRNGLEKINPAENISKISISKIDDSSIRLIITGERQAPTAEVILSSQNLVLSVTPEGATTEQTPDEEIEIIALITLWLMSLKISLLSGRLMKFNKETWKDWDLVWDFYI
jgi:hypothetical protein